ncbi:MAG TPA: hypothetical protein VM818_13255 [Vicinamibacterales bacterium]|jgi:hypothetical protein|nr:hypothetical protein [Vicinamibacterales bacterium]
MTELRCHYSGDREQAIVSYLYGEDAAFDSAERVHFEEHLATCNQCRREVDAFNDVRVSLAGWSPPGLRSPDHNIGSLPGPVSGATSPHVPWWRAMPAWAQAAAALLCVGVAAGIANLEVRYDAEGFRVRTGWLSSQSEGAAAAAVAGTGEAPWRADLVALEERVRSDVRATAMQAPAGTAAIPPATSVGPDPLRRVRALIEESERRQQRELALRLAETVREMNAQRQADLVRIDRNIGLVQNTTGREMMRQRSEMLNYLTVRTASQRPQ